MAQRLLRLYNGIVEVMEQFRPHVVAVEQLYAHYDHPRTAILMGHARGVIFLAAAQRGCRSSATTPRRSRRPSPATAGRPRNRCSGRSSASWVWPKLPEPPDVADALAAALCHYYAAETALAVRTDDMITEDHRHAQSRPRRRGPPAGRRARIPGPGAGVRAPQLQNQVGQEITLHTSHYFDGNPMQGRVVPRLIGFTSEAELDFFDLFCTVDKVGVRRR